MVLDSVEKMGLNTKKTPVLVPEVFTKCCMFLQPSFEDTSHWQCNRFEACSSPSHRFSLFCQIAQYSVTPYAKKCKILLQQLRELMNCCKSLLQLSYTYIAQTYNKLAQTHLNYRTNPQNHLVEGLSPCKVAHKEEAPPSFFKTKLKESS